jgi:hypothetical protein
MVCKVWLVPPVKRDTKDFLAGSVWTEPMVLMEPMAAVVRLDFLDFLEAPEAPGSLLTMVFPEAKATWDLRARKGQMVRKVIKGKLDAMDTTGSKVSKVILASTVSMAQMVLWVVVVQSGMMAPRVIRVTKVNKVLLVGTVHVVCKVLLVWAVCMVKRVTKDLMDLKVVLGRLAVPPPMVTRVPKVTKGRKDKMDLLVLLKR